MVIGGGRGRDVMTSAFGIGVIAMDAHAESSRSRGMTRGSVGLLEAKALPQRHRDTETESLNSFPLFFSVSLCLCGNAYSCCCTGHRGTSRRRGTSVSPHHARGSPRSGAKSRPVVGPVSPWPSVALRVLRGKSLQSQSRTPHVVLKHETMRGHPRIDFPVPPPNDRGACVDREPPEPRIKTDGRRRRKPGRGG